MSRKKGKTAGIVVGTVLLLGVLRAAYTVVKEIDFRKDEGQPTLTLSECAIENGVLTGTFQNDGKKRYQGMPTVQLLTEAASDSGFLRLTPEGYYDEMNRYGTEDYSGAAVIPPKETVSFQYALTEEEQRELSAALTTGASIYACVPSYDIEEEELSFCPVTLDRSENIILKKAIKMEEQS